MASTDRSTSARGQPTPGPQRQAGSTVRDVTYDLLRAYGLTTIFGNLGSTEEPFLANFPSDFRYILALQETSVVALTRCSSAGLSSLASGMAFELELRRSRVGSDASRPYRIYQVRVAALQAVAM